MEGLFFGVWATIAIGVFLLARDFFCWYIKTGKIARGIDETNRLLGQLLAFQKARDWGRKKCPCCAELILEDAVKCRFCGVAVEGKGSEP